MEDTENKGKEREEIFSRAIRAGKRTYFFDVKNTAEGEAYLTITESKRKLDEEGSEANLNPHGWGKTLNSQKTGFLKVQVSPYRTPYVRNVHSR